MFCRLKSLGAGRGGAGPGPAGGRAGSPFFKVFFSFYLSSDVVPTPPDKDPGGTEILQDGECRLNLCVPRKKKKRKRKKKNRGKKRAVGLLEEQARGPARAGLSAAERARPAPQRLQKILEAEGAGVPTSPLRPEFCGEPQGSAQGPGGQGTAPPPAGLTEGR